MRSKNTFFRVIFRVVSLVFGGDEDAVLLVGLRFIKDELGRLVGGVGCIGLPFLVKEIAKA